MPINKAVLAAFKAASRIKPDIRKSYEAQRVAEDVTELLVQVSAAPHGVECAMSEAIKRDTASVLNADPG